MSKNKTSIIGVEDVVNIWKIISKNWYILVISLLVSFSVSWLYTYRLNEIYAAQSQVLLQNNETYDYQSQLFKGLGYYNQDYSNEIQVISSNDLINKTLSKLKFNISYYIVGRIKTTEVFDAMPFEVSIQMNNYSLYETDFKLRIINDKQFELSYSKENKIISLNGNFNEPIKEVDFFITIKRNELLNVETLEDLRQINYVFRVHNTNELISKYKSALKLENVPSTRIIQLTLEDAIPYRAVTFLDSLAKVYIDYTAESRIKINENTLDNIDKQLKEITSILNGIEDNMEIYKANKGVLNLTRQENQYFDNLTSLEAHKKEYELYIGSLESLEKYVISTGNSKDEKLLPPSFYIEPGDDYLKTALGKLYTFQMNKNEALTVATEINKGINQLDQNIELLRKNLLTYISNSKNGLRQKIADIDVQIEEYTNIIKLLPKTQRDLLTIQRQLDVNEKIYGYLLEKRASTLITRAGILPETTIIESAHSLGIVKPDKTKISYYFLLAGFVIALIIVFLRITIFYKIQSIEELKKMTNLPVLGQVNQIFESDIETTYPNIVDKDPRNPITENFRIIRTNIGFMANETTSKIILLTSYNPGEGKTFCSVNLATILAKASRKVLLIELDLHRPKIQEALKLSSGTGVSNILIGRTRIEECILKTSITNLDTILSGPTAPNASELILSKALGDLFEYARTNYDYVIVDTPPIGLITDAIVIMRYSDVNLFVLNSKFANKNVISFVEEFVSNNKIKNLGLILNGVKRSHSRYSYGYGYGYGYYNKNEENAREKAS